MVLPNNTHRPAAGHRRGLSLDIRQQPNSASSTPGQNYMVSTTTNNTGLANNVQHHVPQQRLQARPGPLRTYTNVNMTLGGNSPYLTAPNGTPQFDASNFDLDNISFDAYSNQLNVMMNRGQAVYGDSMMGGKEFDMLNNDSALSTPTYVNFPESPSAQGWASEGDTSSTRKVTRRISNGILDRVNKFENLPEAFTQGPQIPSTPPNDGDQGKASGLQGGGACRLTPA